MGALKSSADVLAALAAYESPNVTHVDPAGGWPMVWARARGARVWDLEGREYLDLTAAFGVAAAGHGNRAVIQAMRAQAETLLHAMGDVHPHALKASLCRELSRITYGRWMADGRGMTILSNSGFEAVESALKTALLATKKPGVIAFEGGYHGLGYGALNATHREHFRGPFGSQLARFGRFLRFPSHAGQFHAIEQAIRDMTAPGGIGAIIVEPLQARGGIRVPPPGFLSMLRRVATETGVLLILDEIYTGFGRTGAWFACEHEKVAPDLICLGKALTGGFPLSACVGRSDLMETAWPRSEGEAIHTSTFLGHPVGCAMALAQIKEITRRDLCARSAKLGDWLAKSCRARAAKLKGLVVEARGRGLMVGVEARQLNGEPATSLCVGAMKRLLAKGFIFLPEGAESNVLAFTPPLTITKAELSRAAAALFETLEELIRP